MAQSGISLPGSSGLPPRAGDSVAASSSVGSLPARPPNAVGNLGMAQGASTGALPARPQGTSTGSSTGALPARPQGMATGSAIGGLPARPQGMATGSSTGGLPARPQGMATSSSTGGLPARPQGMATSSSTGGLPARPQGMVAGNSTGGLPARPPDNAAISGQQQQYSNGAAMPALDLDAAKSAAVPQFREPGPGDVKLGAECENEIDRLVRERLEGGFSHRVHAKRRFEGIGAYHRTPLGCFEGGVREAVWSLWYGVTTGPGILFERVEHATGVGATCNRVIKAAPVIVCGHNQEEEDGDYNYHNAPPAHILGQQPDNDFQDLVSVPLAVKAANANAMLGAAKPLSVGCSKAVAENLSRSAESSGTPQPQPNRFSPLTTGPPTPSPESALNQWCQPEMVNRPKPSRGKLNDGEDGSSRLSSAFTSCLNTGAETRSTAGDRAQIPPAPPPPPAMTSSASDAVGGLGFGGAGGASSSSTANGPADRGNAAAASSGDSYVGGANPRSNRAAGTESVLAASSGMTSAAASALGGLAPGGTSRSAAQAASGNSGAKSSSDGGGTSGRRPGGNAKSVVSGIGASSSAASGLLGPLLQGGGGGKRGGRGAEAASVVG